MTSFHFTPMPLSANVLAALKMVLDDLPVLQQTAVAQRKQRTSLRLAIQVAESFPAEAQDEALLQLRHLLDTLEEQEGAAGLADVSVIASQYLAAMAP